MIARPAPRAGLTRRGVLGLGALAAAAPLSACGGDARPGGTSAGPTATGSSASTTGPAAALARLRAGNERFATGSATHPHQDAAARASVAEHQHPWALVHGCVDSRVAPELVFDQGIGDLFTTRTAGAVLDDTLVGSMEFAASAPYAVPLVVVLGHTGCGAVTAAVDAVAKDPRHPSAPGEIADIVHEIAPIARRLARRGEHTVDDVVRANTVAVAERLVARSRILRAAVRDGRTRVVPAVYDLDSGRVDWDL